MNTTRVLGRKPRRGEAVALGVSPGCGEGLFPWGCCGRGRLVRPLTVVVGIGLIWRCLVLAFWVWVVKNGVMERRFRRVDREQRYLLPPDVREWLPAGHPALFLVELVESLDLSAFVAANRSSRVAGRPAYAPSVMVGIVLYASMTQVLSSRRIERLLWTDAAFRVVAANERPDHVTICRFLNRHSEPLADLFAQVVGLAAEAGLVDPTLVALDGTKMAGNASRSRNETLGKLRERFRGWAGTVAENDAADDAAEQESGPQGPVPEMAERAMMRAWIRRKLAERAAEADERRMNLTDPDSALMPRSGGGWVQGYNAQAAAVAGGIVVAADVVATPVDHQVLDAMVECIDTAVREATGERAGVVVADAGYWHADTVDPIDADPERADLLISPGRKIPKEAPPAPNDDAYRAECEAIEESKRAERARRVEVIARVVAGELLLRQGAEMLGISICRVFELKQAWINAGGPDAIVAPRRKGRRRLAKPPKTPAAVSRHAMNTRLASPAGRSFYRQRQAIIEPVFGDIKTNRRTNRFLRRGLDPARTEWLWILMGHNLTILHRNT